jgi:hypothetical protein
MLFCWGFGVFLVKSASKVAKSDSKVHISAREVRRSALQVDESGAKARGGGRM